MSEEDKDKQVVRIRITEDYVVEIPTDPDSVRQINGMMDHTAFIDCVDLMLRAQHAGVDMEDTVAVVRFRIDSSPFLSDDQKYDRTGIGPDNERWKIWWNKAQLAQTVWLWQDMFPTFDAMYRDASFQIDWQKTWDLPYPDTCPF